MSDVKQSTLDNIVRGLTKNPRVKTLHKIALAFNMTLAEFLDFDELNDYVFDEYEEESCFPLFGFAPKRGLCIMEMPSHLTLVDCSLQRESHVIKTSPFGMR